MATFAKPTDDATASTGPNASSDASVPMSVTGKVRLHFKGRPRRDDTSRRVSVQSRAHSLKECSDRRAPGETESAICVQRLDDSLNSAIHTRYRSLLRSSSMHEPRGPPLEVVLFQINKPKQTEKVLKKKLMIGGAGRRVAPALTSTTTWLTPSPAPTNSGTGTEQFTGDGRKTPTGNDPSAGSPTETLLRLLLPLNDQV